MAAGGSTATAHARRLLARVDQLNIEGELLDDAATLARGTLLRTLDALHLASALTLGPDLRTLVTYDERMAAAAQDLGLAVEAPA